MLLGNTPFLASHLDGDTAWVDLLFVPAPQRRHGHGSHMLATWMHRLPSAVRRIEVLAADVDGEPSAGFWRKMGFEIDDAFASELFDGTYMARRLDRPPPSSA